MRIGIIAPPWYPVPPWGYGGTEGMIDVLARGIMAAGHDVCLFTTADSTCPVPRLHLLPEGLGVAAMADETAELTHLDAAYSHLGDCDVIHDHTLLGPAVQSASCPVVTTVHGPIDTRTRQFLATYPGNVLPTAISHSQRGLAPSGSFSAVVHHGIDMRHWPVGSGSGGYLLFLGRMSPDKGVDAAITVARRAGMPLRIAARIRGPEEKRYFIEAVRPRLGGTVEFLGEVGPGERLALLGEATALLNPLRWSEPFGLVMIEALAVGTPVVTTRWGSSPEIVSHGLTGHLAATTSDLVDGCRLAASLDRDECRASAVERFSAERMVEEYLDLYRSALCPGPGVDLRSTGATAVVGDG